MNGGKIMLYEYQLPAPREDFYNITAQVREAIRESGVTNGTAVVFNPHTTAGITINDIGAFRSASSLQNDTNGNADPDVVHDLLYGLNKVFPDRPEFRHGEGNSAAHMKASAMGSGVTVIIENGKLLLGTWQGIYFCEFDPPRQRKFYVKVVAGS